MAAWAGWSPTESTEFGGDLLRCQGVKMHVTVDEIGLGVEVAGMAGDEFESPSRVYRALNFWSWNDELDPAELPNHLRLIKEAGWGGTYLHPRPGMLTPYLSEEWMEAIRVSVEAGRRLGLDIWLYDEDCWPSGVAGGAVCLQNPEYRQRVLVRRGLGETAVDGERLVARDERWAYFEHPMAMGGHFHSAIIDAINPNAVRSFIELTYERYRKRFGSEFGKTIPGIFMDEPHLTTRYAQPGGSMAWTPRLPELFISRWGYDLSDHLASLFEESGDWRKVRYHYWRVVDELMASSFNQQLYQWCEGNGLLFAGHMTCEESLHSQLAWSGSVMSAYAFFHIPGVDMLGRKIDEVVTLKQCVSVARQLGRDRVQSELFGTAGANTTLEDMKWITDWHVALGVNMFCVHLSNYSIRGGRKHDCPPNIFFHQPYWKYIPALSDHMARCSYAMLRGRPQADILVLHPIESAWMRFLPPDGPRVFEHCHKSMADLQEHLLQLSENLLALHRDYDFGAESIMAGRSRVVNGKLHVGEASYDTVILPAIETIRQETLDLLIRFVRQGGLLITTGRLPDRVEGEVSESVVELGCLAIEVANTSESLSAMLDKHRPQDVVVRSHGTAKVMSSQRILSDGYVLFVANTDRLQDAEVSIEVVDGLGELGVCHWDSITGQARPVPWERCDGKLKIRLTLPAVGSRILEIASAGRLAVSEETVEVDQVRCDDLPATVLGQDVEWKITRTAPNALVLDRCRFRLAPEEAWSAVQRTSEIQKRLVDIDYHGRLEMDYEFEWRGGSIPASTRLIVEEADQWRIAVNGEPCEGSGEAYWLDRAFLPVAIAHAVRAGRNTVRLERVFAPPRYNSPAFMPRLRGVEIEPIYVTGDFAVRARVEDPIREVHPAWGLTGLPLPSTQLLTSPFEIVDEPGTCHLGDLVTQGYPFYAGTVELSARVPMGRCRGLIGLGDVQACVAEVVANGGPPKVLRWSPWQADVSDDLVEGDNHLVLRLTNSLRNLMGHHHLVLQGEGDISHLATRAYCDMSWASGEGWLPPRIPDWQYRLASFGVSRVEVF